MEENSHLTCANVGLLSSTCITSEEFPKAVNTVVALKMMCFDTVLFCVLASMK